MDKSSKLLPENIVNCINDFRTKKWSELQLEKEYVNALLREDIFSLLEKFCVVLYYPLDDETNNGFHIDNLPIFSGDISEVVFINTNQTTEKQIFTAAHELGHIWHLDEYITEQIGHRPDYTTIEKIMNRFAAELMIPTDHFKTVLGKAILANQQSPEGDKSNIIKIIAHLMNEFFVPYKSIVWRLFELGFLSEAHFDTLCPANDCCSDDDPSLRKVYVYLYNCIKEEGYDKLLQRTQKKYIKDFSDYLKKAELKGNISSSKITLLREEFDIPSETPDVPVNDISFDQEGR